MTDADYEVTGLSTPAHAEPPPPPPEWRAQQQMAAPRVVDAGGAGAPVAPAAAPASAMKPTVNEVTVQVRKVAFVDAPGSRGTKEVTIGMKASPAPGQAGHHAIDQLWKTVKTKAEALLGEWE